MKKYALDTNIISYILKRNDGITKNFVTEKEKGNTFNIPPLVYYEINRGLLSINATKMMKEFDKLCRQLKVGEMNRKIWNEAIKIYATLKNQGKLIEDADIFIAAYCIIYNYVLVTNNKNHFERVNDLDFIEWKENL